MAKIVIYTTNYCPYCHAAKALLKGRSMDFAEINVANDDAKRAWLKKVTGQMTVPQIFINDQSVGGYQELAAMDVAGKLDHL